ncbi:MAG TPA: 50S ribosomal protein L4 [Candidatus Portnoybacteria bacterium]|nr:50S ribosomal protein L4 [Candidatus Portnoybacteria bacterium]
MTAIKSTTKEAAVKKTVKAKAPVESVKSGSVLDLAVFDQAGKEVSKISLPKEVFGLKVNADLVSQTVTAQMANSRESIAHSKDRSEVRGGGKKPWKQKGTGRARHASIRSPLWAGGGATFGPRKERNFSLSINKKMKRQALKMVLSGKASDGEIIILESLKLAQPKTREMAVIINKLASGAKKELNRGVMIILSQKDEAVLRAARNLPKVAMIGVGSLNVVDLLSTKYLVISSEAVEKIKAMYQAK